jgi:hypothetical protein
LSTPSSSPRAKDLAGTWRLARHVRHDAQGRLAYPFGLRPRGLLVYGADGFMSVAIVNPKRKGDFLFYSGRWTLRRGSVVHRIEIASSDRLGKVVTRRAALEGDRLVQTTPAFGVDGK